jgi:hypothetical protein
MGASRAPRAGFSDSPALARKHKYNQLLSRACALGKGRLISPFSRAVLDAGRPL